MHVKETTVGLSTTNWVNADLGGSMGRREVLQLPSPFVFGPATLWFASCSNDVQHSWRPITRKNDEANEDPFPHSFPFLGSASAVDLRGSLAIPRLDSWFWCGKKTAMCSGLACGRYQGVKVERRRRICGILNPWLGMSAPCVGTCRKGRSPTITPT